ncbi:hypothetical protein [Bifidobacterium scaligerum]|uniref:Uncharacterized protein n=1 Tax=Bifidobacterium scaligerum TaxID=2052656 RepID=A0A2M9HQE1_9BIFI|nr:hypothetical protein [Bifidobacterium scaligerum]PJM79022.1 hypothetical protein CUU80_06700 [Bifidobacterium scaligerum]
MNEQGNETDMSQGRITESKDTAQTGEAGTRGDRNPTDPELALKSARSEAAKLRTRAQEAESQRDQLAQQLAAMQGRLDAARRLSLRHESVFDRVQKSAIDDVIDMLDVESMYDDQGNLDHDKLDADVRGLLKTKPYLGAGLPDSVKEILSQSAPHPIGRTGGDRLQNALIRH